MAARKERVSDPAPTVPITSFEASERVWTVLIDCGSCAMADLACGDCVVSVLLGAPGQPQQVEDSHIQAIGVLADQGLIPPLRLISGPSDGGTPPSAAAS
jgi:hypothetical protein